MNQKISDAIIDSKMLLFLTSENAYASKAMMAKIIYAFNNKEKNSLLPYIIDDSTLPKSLQLTFASTNWRTMKLHPIRTVLINDIKNHLAKPVSTDVAADKGAVSQKEVKPADEFSVQDFLQFASFENKRSTWRDDFMAFFAPFALFLFAGYGAAKLGTMWFGLSTVWQWVIGVLVFGGLFSLIDKYIKTIMMNACKSKDFGKAFRYARMLNRDALKASDEMNEDVAYMLGIMFALGYGVSQDFKRSLKFFDIAAKSLHADALCLLGCQYLWGLGCETNKDLGMKHLKKAKSHGSEMAGELISKYSL